MKKIEKIKKLDKKITEIYFQHKDKLLFHGWHHINFVRNKALMFGKNLKADPFILESTALVHDLNYIVKPNSDPKDGKQIRRDILSRTGYTKQESDWIERIINESHTANRKKNISIEAKALSDADTLFKILPTTPILFSNKCILENQIDIKKMADKIIKEQKPLLESGIYFYTKEAKQKYLRWAKINLNLWKNIQECLDDQDVKEMLAIAKKLKVL